MTLVDKAEKDRAERERDAMRAERDAALAENARLRAAVEGVCATHDDTQWWPVVPYMDPPNDDEVVEVHVVDVDRVRAALAAPTADDGAERGAR